jgi:hypothetical protein
LPTGTRPSAAATISCCQLARPAETHLALGGEVTKERALGHSGAEVRGDIQDIDILWSGAEQAEGVVHLAFRHDIAWTGHLDQAAASGRHPTIG